MCFKYFGEVIFDAGLQGLAIILIGLLKSRWLGIFAFTWGSSITVSVMVVGDMAKATVQAAIGGSTSYGCSSWR